MKILVAVEAQALAAPTPRAWVALEAGLELRARGHGDSEVVLASVGGSDAERSLRRGLAMGADRAILAGEQALEDAEALTMARVLAKVAAREAPTLILCAAHGTGGVAGIAMAGLLDLPHVAFVDAIDGERLTVERELEGGAVEQLSIATPALLSVQRAGHPPRQPTLREIERARAKPLEVLNLADLGLELATLVALAGSRTIGLGERPRGPAAPLGETPSEIAAQIVRIVQRAVRV